MITALKIQFFSSYPNRREAYRFHINCGQTRSRPSSKRKEPSGVPSSKYGECPWSIQNSLKETFQICLPPTTKILQLLPNLPSNQLDKISTSKAISSKKQTTRQKTTLYMNYSTLSKDKLSVFVSVATEEYSQLMKWEQVSLFNLLPAAYYFPKDFHY